METGPSSDPGKLTFEGSWRPLGALTAKYRDRELEETITLPTHQIEYLIFHYLPEGDDAATDPNQYAFISIGGLEYEESDTKMFVLVLEDDATGQLHVFDTKELDIHVARTGHNNYPDELVHWVRDDMAQQLQLGSATPNQEELERFEEIVKAWQLSDQES